MVPLSLALLLFTFVKLSESYNIKEVDPLVAYVKNGNNVDIKPSWFSVFIEKLFPGNKMKFQHIVRKNLQLQEAKPALRICTYEHPCKPKKKEESCGVKPDSCEQEKKINDCDKEKKKGSKSNRKKKKKSIST